MNQRLLKFTALTASSIVGLLICELGLRFLLPGYNPKVGAERGYFCEFDQELGWAPLRNITGKHDDDGFTVEVYQNRFGLRGGDEMTHERKQAQRRILVVGDSYIWGYGVHQNEMFSSPEAHKDKNVELIPFGVSGYGTDQEYLFYKREGVKFDVDEVVLAVTIYNDIANNSEKKQYGYNKPYFTLKDQKLQLHAEHIKETRRLKGWWERARAKCYTLNLADSFTRNLKNKLTGNQEEIVPEARRMDTHQISSAEMDSIKLTGKIIKAFSDEVTGKGAKFSVIIIPFRPHVELGLKTDHPYAEVLKQELAESGIACIDSYAQFIEAKSRGAKLFNGLDNHFSAEGHKLFASQIIGK